MSARSATIRSATIISDALRAPMPTASSDWRDVPRHHRYYGSSACNGGERLTESRRGAEAPTKII